MKATLRYTALIVGMILLSAGTAWADATIQQATLSNGLKVLLIEAHNVPMVSMQLALPAGSRFDPDGKGGAAGLLATMLTDHTARHDDQELAEWLDQRALHVGADVDQDAMKMSVSTLVDELPSALDVLSECVMQPGWNKKRFKILRQDTVAAAQKALEEPGVRAAEAATALVFAGHPYGHRPDGNPQSLAAIELSDLQNLYQAQVRPKGAVLAVSGDITMALLQPLLESHFADWQGAPTQSLKEIPQVQVRSGQQTRIDMPTTQAMVELVRLGPSRSDAQFFPAYIMNHILGGGGFASQLMQEVREKRGLVYGVYSYFIPLTVSGPFTIALQTRADQADQAEVVVRDVMRAMAGGGVTKKQVDDAKDNLIGGFAQRMDSNAERVGLMGMIGLYGLPLNYLQVWKDRIQAVTLDQVREQAAKYLDPDAWNEIRVGPLPAAPTPQP